MTIVEQKAIKKAALESGECGVVEDELKCFLAKSQFNDHIEGLENTNDCTAKYIEDLNNIFEASNCNLENFSTAYRDYFGIAESTEEQTAPTIGIGDILCENIFTVTSVEDDLHVSAGISGVSFQVKNKNNALISISHPYVQIMIADNIGSCSSDYTYESIMAEALNATINGIDMLMDDYISFEDLNNASDFGDDQIVDDIFQKFLGQEIWDIYYLCNATPSAYPILSENAEWGEKCNTVYNQLSESNINDCE